MSAADAVTDTQSQAAAEASAASTSTASSNGASGASALTGADESQPPVDSDALTALQLAALASKTLHGGPDQATDALVARYDM